VAERHGIEYIFCSSILLSKSAIKEMANEALSQFKVIDVLINNAGTQFVSPIEDFPDEKWDEILTINYLLRFI
jgi:3-hydroxybutyrate dehydrogenase